MVDEDDANDDDDDDANGAEDDAEEAIDDPGAEIKRRDDAKSWDEELSSDTNAG
jgi:hypothetical protein